MPAYKDPAELFNAAVAAMDKGDWPGAAALCDPMSLVLFQRQLIAMVSPEHTGPELTVEDIMRSDPDMPRAAAEYQINRMRRFRDPMTVLRQEIPGVESVEELRRFAPAAAFARVLAGRSPSAQIERVIASGAVPPGGVEAIRASARRMIRQPELVGVLRDGENLTHIFYRAPVSTPEMPQWPSATAEERSYQRDVFNRGPLKSNQCRRQADGGWLLIADRSFLSAGQIAGFGSGAGDDDHAVEIEEELSP